MRARSGRHDLPARWGRGLPLLLGGLATGLIAAALTGCSKDDSVDAGGELTYTVTRGDLLISFTERGNVKAAKSHSIYSHLEGDHTIVNLVPEGTNVKAGDVLVELDASELQQLLNQQQIQVDTADADLLQAQEGLEIQKSLSESAISKAALDLQLGEIDFEKYSSPRGDSELASTKARADKTIAEEELKRAENEYEWTQKLSEKGYVTGTELIADRLAVSKAKLQLEQAVGSLDLLERYTHKKELAKVESAVREAKQAIERERRKARASIAQADAAAKGKQSTLNLSKKRLTKLVDQLEKARVRAPQDGMVVYPNVESWRRERMIMLGAEVHEGQLLMNLPDVSTMAVDVQVHESWVDQVREGLPAFVGIDAFPNLNLKGKVTKVGLLPDSVNRWLNPDLKVYLTEITLDDSPGVDLLKPGMSAKVQIIIALLKDVVFVPVQAVTTMDKKQVCYVLEGGKFTPREVSGGRYNDSFIQIALGLKEGEVVQLNAPAPQGGRRIEGTKAADDLARAIESAGAPPGDPEAGPGRNDRSRKGEGPKDAAAAAKDGEEWKKGRRSRKERGEPEVTPRPAALKAGKDAGAGAQ